MYWRSKMHESFKWIIMIILFFKFDLREYEFASFLIEIVNAAANELRDNTPMIKLEDLHENNNENQYRLQCVNAPD
jgi:hypothetical protein